MGSLEHRASQSCLPAGPSNVQELMEWPLSVVRMAFERPGWEARRRALLEPGIWEASDYSGVFAEHEARRLLFQAISILSGWAPRQHVSGRVCDSDENVQKLLLHMSKSESGGNMCVMPDINGMVAPLAQGVQDALAPDDSCTDRESFIEGYKEMERWLVENRM